MTLTYAGQALKTRARELLDLRDETYKEISDIKDFSTGQLSIGVSHTRGRFILPEILPTYQREFPGIELHLAEGNSSELANDLLHGNIDLMIDLLPFTAENVATVPICQEEILLVVPDEVIRKAYPDRFEEIKKSLYQSADVRLLENCPFVLLKKGNRVRTIADEIFEDTQISPHIVLETENIETVLALSAQGMGITFYPRMFMSTRQNLNAYKDSLMGQAGLNLFFLELFQSPRHPCYRLSQRPLYVPCHPRIYPHCTGAYPFCRRTSVKCRCNLMTWEQKRKRRSPLTFCFLFLPILKQ